MAQARSIAPHIADARELDAALVVRVRTGDASAFEILFRAYYPKLASLAYGYVKSREIAEELVQDTLLRVWEDRASWDVRGSVSSYLYAAVRHRAISHLRRVRVATHFEDDAAAASRHEPGAGVFASRVPAADEGLEEADLQAAVDRAVGELPARCREAFLLSRQHQLSHAEIATTMGTSIKTVENQIIKARKHLRDRLAPWIEG